MRVVMAEQESLAERALNWCLLGGAELVPPAGSGPADLHNQGSSQKTQGEVL